MENMEKDMTIKAIYFTCDGLRYRAFVGLAADLEQEKQEGGGIYFAFGSGSYPMASFFFQDKSWPSYGYYLEKMKTSRSIPAVDAVGYLALVALMGQDQETLDGRGVHGALKEYLDGLRERDQLAFMEKFRGLLGPLAVLSLR